MKIIFNWLISKHHKDASAVESSDIESLWTTKVPNESVYDAFGAGHSSTSISAAIGYEIASKLKNEKKKIVAIIGDGGLTAGMAFEALGHAGGIKSDILVVLNDNEMSISPNVGAVHKYLTRILTGKAFSSLKESGKKVLGKVKAIEEIAKKVENQAKGFITPGLLFEELGFKYYGPVDGHDTNGLIYILANLKDKSGPIIELKLFCWNI